MNQHVVGLLLLLTDDHQHDCRVQFLRGFIAFIAARQGDTIRIILEHCGLWHGPPTRAPPQPSPPSGPVRSLPASDPGITHELDPDFLEDLRREVIDQPEPPWEP